MLNDLSNKAFAWLTFGLILLVFTAAIIWHEWSALTDAARYIGMGLIVLAAVAVIVVVYILWHKHTMLAYQRRAEKQRLFLEQQAQAHAHEVEKQRLALEQSARFHTQQLEQQWMSLEQQAKLQAQEMDRQRMLHEQSLERAREAREAEATRRKIESEALLARERFELERHLALTRIPVSAHGYDALLGENENGYSITQIPYTRPQLAQNAATKDEQQAKKGPVIVDDRPIPPPVDVFTLLERQMWYPDEKSLLLAIGPDGPVTVDYALAWHIALAGATGGGKTNELRLILAQMVMYNVVYYISPAFAPIKANHEDWRQIQARLAGPVARHGHEIEFRLKWALDELRRRQEAEFRGDHSWKGKKIYIVVDEYKEVIARYPDAPQDISNLLRQARQYDIFVVVAAQDFLIKNIGGDSGARDCYRTALYFGGDPNTCRALLDVQGTLPFEEHLGKEGHMVLRTKSTKVSQARAPFMSNRAIYTLLEWPDDPILDDAPVVPIGDRKDSSGTFGDFAPERNEGTFSTSRESVVESVMEPLMPKDTGPLVTPSNASTERLGTGPETFLPGPDDKVMSDTQISQFVRLYRKFGNVKECLRRLEIGNAYSKHASHIVQLYNLKKDA